MMKKQTLLLALTLPTLVALQANAQSESWVEKAVHNFGAPINTMWAEGELSFAADGTMVYCSARQDMAVADGDPKDAINLNNLDDWLEFHAAEIA